MATVAEVKTHALEMLGVVDVGVTPSTAFLTRVQDSYDKVFAELKSDGIATWASTGVIPDEFAMHVEAMMAFEASDSYHISDKRFARIKAREMIARREMRKFSTPDYESLDEPRDY